MTRFLFIKSDTEVLSVPAENLFSVEYESAGKVALRFKTVRSGLEGTSKVVLNVTAGREQEVVIDIDKQIKLPNKSFVYTDVAVSSNEKNRAGGFIARSAQKSTLDVLSIDSITHTSDPSGNTYAISCVDGDNSDEEKVRLTDSSGVTDDIVLEAGTGLSIARAGDKITFTNTVSNLASANQSLAGARLVDCNGENLEIDVNGGEFKLDELTHNYITATANQLQLQGFTFPASDGIAGQVLKTNGAKVLSFGNPSRLTQVYSTSFLRDISTSKIYLPFKDINEQTQVYQEEVAMLMPFDGKIRSISLKGSQVTGGGNFTVGIETLPVGDSIFSTSNWNSQETEQLAFGGADSNHLFHFVFSNAKHFDAGEVCSLFLQADADPGSNTYWHVTVVIDFDTSNNLGASSIEYETTP